MTTQEKLQQQPKLVKQLNGRDYIPIGTVEEQLDEIDPSWGARGFNITYTPFADGGMHISGSLELYIHPNDFIPRIMVGAYSMFYDPHGGQFDLAGVVRSECIKNAATSLGIYFGRGLNGRLEGNEAEPKEPNVELPDENTTDKIKSNLKIS